MPRRAREVTPWPERPGRCRTARCRGNGRGRDRRSAPGRDRSPSGAPGRRSRRSCPRARRSGAGDPDADPSVAPLAPDVEPRQRRDDPFLEPPDVTAHVAAPALEVQHHIGDALPRSVIGVLPAAAAAVHRQTRRVEQVLAPARWSRPCRAAGAPAAISARGALPSRIAAIRVSISATASSYGTSSSLIRHSTLPDSLLISRGIALDMGARIC